ncbi:MULTISPECIES: hypothetical protein [Mesorhizobium]|uniref:Beta-glucosidase/6-phospho-beta-glucosidase/beta-galactosidase n=1 Tax=Mesorhizobium australicum (strain HAMBI 3006 / LMG 24608 / WSM2073) TaxID=754035 RepID=L0KMC4_MESAW|nr:MULTISPECIES: hypothetical protein [Mesorhizobium]AGB45154.1 hypothetical protein Mesau_02751 [Mesorhizobium australicum WSM2073]MBZ9698707.1 hypothetical protein [Mesorhizobium sp. CO1-1-9]MBZ9727547.1 hypothetical protein [Mesorhizobium sp. CO1-1-11]TPJ12158.1 hypothetical protein FJW04_23140 [Mesorhizobium sp. B2-7-3]
MPVRSSGIKLAPSDTCLSSAAALLLLFSISLAQSWAALAGDTDTALINWARAKTLLVEQLDREPRSVDAQFNEPTLISRAVTPVVAPSADERARNAATSDLYVQIYGRPSLKSFLWTGVESGNPLTRDESYRWDSLDDQGLFDHERRRVLAARLLYLGILNVRLGLSNHLIDPERDETWLAHDGLIDDLDRAGLRVSLDLHHFGIEDRFRVAGPDGRTKGRASYYLNQDWPAYFAAFSRAAINRYGPRIKAVTLINEPETTIGFNSEMWNGAFPRWQSPLHTTYYIERAVQVAKAAVLARLAIEEELAPSKRRMLYIHPEAAVFKPGWDEFNRHIRFFGSDLILGEDWLLEADFEKLELMTPAEHLAKWNATAPSSRTSLDWAIKHYLDGSPATGRPLPDSLQRVLHMLKEVQDLHRKLNREFKVTMKRDTVFGVDYYAHNEDFDTKGKHLSAEPQNYAGEVSSGARAGLEAVITDYYNRYHLPMMVTETGTPYFNYGARWHQEMLLECAAAASAGVPLLAYSIYPLLDSWGWETALSVSRPQTLLNPSGIFTLALEPRPFAGRLLRSLKAGFQP